MISMHVTLNFASDTSPINMHTHTHTALCCNILDLTIKMLLVHSRVSSHPNYSNSKTVCNNTFKYRRDVNFKGENLRKFQGIASIHESVFRDFFVRKTAEGVVFVLPLY